MSRIFYNYGFCINKEGVTEEWLNSKAKTARKFSTVFYRGTTDEAHYLIGKYGAIPTLKSIDS